MNLNKRIFLYFFSIFFLMLTIICFFQYQREKEFRTEQLDQQLTTYNYTINRFIVEQHPDWDKLKDYVSLFPDSTLRVTVIDTTGVVTFDSSVKKDTVLENHLNRPEIEMANVTVNGKAIQQEKIIITSPIVLRMVTYVARCHTMSVWSVCLKPIHFLCILWHLY